MEISWNFVSPKKWEPCWIIFDMNYWKFGMTDNRVQIDKIQNDPGGWSAYVTCPSGWEAGLSLPTIYERGPQLFYSLPQLIKSPICLTLCWSVGLIVLLFTHFCSVRSVKIKGTIYKSFVLIPLANYKSVFLSCENFLNESKVRVPKVFMCVCY